MSVGIYKITNLINNKHYIGQSVHIEKRWQEHCRPSADSLIAKAIQTYGKDNFTFEILEECSIKELDKLEYKYIELYNSLIPNGYNIVLTNEQNIHTFLKYDKETLLNIINDIKNVELSFSEISKKYSLDLSMIYYLNRGDYHTIDNENYPLRTVKNFSKQHHYCVDCGKEITKKALRCIECGQKAQRRVERPDRNTFKELIRNNSFLSLGKMFDVSDRTICKWCKFYGLPYKKREIDKIPDTEWVEM